MTKAETTEREEKAIRSLKRLAKNWPPTLWLFAGAGGSVCIMKTGQFGQRMMTEEGGVNPDYIVGDIDIPADGGDW